MGCCLSLAHPRAGDTQGVIRSEDKPETSTRSSQPESKTTFVRFFRLKDTGEIGYWDGEKFMFIPLWPERYTKLMDDNMAFASPDEFEDIWVNGLSEQAGPIKMRKGLLLLSRQRQSIGSSSRTLTSTNLELPLNQTSLERTPS
jgi:hypothetical protein